MDINQKLIPVNNNGDTPFHKAAQKGHMELCNLFLEEANIDKNPRNYSGRTPLHIAAKGGYFELCELIFQYVKVKNPRDNNGWTPLHIGT